MDETARISSPQPRLLGERYELRGLLGRGGMADVELAFDRALDREVAVKLLHQRFADNTSFIERFRREALAAASLNHPNVVGVYDTGADGDRPYIVMEYVRGQSLRDMLGDGPSEERLPFERVADIAADAAAGLHYAHERGLVHRDVKPGNILVSEEGRAKVADFGIARAIDAETVTQTAAVFGTAAYVAPEQARGLAVDRRTDVYALGCVLYEMLTGRQPFSGDSAVALAYQHVSQDPIPPREVRPAISPAMEAVVLRAMAKAPPDRYQTARELHDDIRRAAQGLTVRTPAETTRVVAVSPPLEEAVEEQPRRRTPLLIALVLAVLAALGAGGYLLANRSQQPPAAPPVVIPDVNGLELIEAQARLRGLGLVPQVGEPVFDPRVPAGRIVRTDPPAREQVPLGREVILVPSQGPPLVDVPDVAGQTVDDATTALRRARLALGSVSERDSTTVGEGEVIGTDPESGRRIRQGSRVTLLVSSGPPPFDLPNVIDVTRDEAISRLQNACGSAPCVDVDTAEAFSDTTEANRVIRQNPSPGTSVERGETVTLVVSLGSRPEPSPVPIPEPSTEPSNTQTETPSDTGQSVTPTATESESQSESSVAIPTSPSS